MIHCNASVPVSSGAYINRTSGAEQLLIPFPVHLSRRSTLAAALALISSQSGLGQSILNAPQMSTKVPNQLTTQNQQIKPYLQVPTVSSEENTVRVFFSPNCPFSAQYFDFFVNLSKTLPAGLKFELSALPNAKDSTAYALSYSAVRRFYPKYLKRFVQASFKACQELRLSSQKWQVIQKIGAMSNLPSLLPELILNNKELLKSDLISLIQLCRALEITNTPCVAVDGTYTVTPEFVPGASPEMFNQLVNSVISMSLGA